MLKYNNYEVTFAEIPDEICLYITLTGCPIHCPECNSKWLWEDTGTELTIAKLEQLIKENSGITCVVFGGGDGSIITLDLICFQLKRKYPDLKLAFYSGSKNIHINLCKYIDYYKIGPFDPKYGPLNNPMTNQRLYKVEWIETNFENQLNLIDITDKFWK